MTTKTLALAAIAFAALAAPAFAQDATGSKVKLDDLEATRINANQITIAFDYEGGACEEVSPSEVGELVDGTLAVTFPTLSTAEVCTMQLEKHEVKQTIPADYIISRIDVTLTDKDGKTIATGSTDVEHE